MGGARRRPRRDGLLTAGDVARHFGLTPQMVHVYATMGLIRERRRTPGGFRLFGPDTVKRLDLVRKLNQRYSLREIARTFSFKG